MLHVITEFLGEKLLNFDRGKKPERTEARREWEEPRIVSRSTTLPPLRHQIGLLGAEAFPHSLLGISAMLFMHRDEENHGALLFLTGIMGMLMVELLFMVLYIPRLEKITEGWKVKGIGTVYFETFFNGILNQRLILGIYLLMGISQVVFAAF